MKKKKVLIVDDEETSREIALFDLQDAFDCVTAVDAFDAYEKLSQAFKLKEPFNITVLDEIMPGMDGVALLKIIRINEKYMQAVKDSPMKFVIMSSVESEKYLQKIYSALWDDRFSFVKKPFDKGQLLQIIISILN